MTVVAVAWSVLVCNCARAPLFVLGWCAVALLQVVPIPDALLTMIAPISAGAWKVATAGSATWGTVSIDPAATAVGIRRMLLWLGATIAIKDAANTPAARQAIGCALATSAAIMWALALAFPVDVNKRLVLGFIDMKGPTAHWWRSGADLPVRSDGGGFLEWAVVGSERYRYDEVLVGDGFGPYVTSNQFAGGFCLTLPFLFAAVVLAARRFGKPLIGYTVVGALMTAATWTLWERAGSRAGTASLLMAHAVFAVAVAQNIVTRRIAAVVATVYGVVLLLLIAGLVGLLPGLEQWFPEPLQAKLATFLNDSRAVAANVSRRIFLASMILGTGISSYAAIYPRFSPGDLTLYYAYNDYSQLLAETGLVGIAAAIFFAIPVFVRLARISFVPTSENPVAAAAAAAIAGLAAHMAFEWNLHQPANAFLGSIAVGLFLAIVPVQKRPAEIRITRNLWRLRTTTVAFAVACGISFVLLARDARSDAAVKAYRYALVAARPAPKDSPRPAPKPLLERALAQGEQATAWDPRNATLELLAGQARLHLAQFETGPSREAMLSLAELSFRKARWRRATVVGLPEPTSTSNTDTPHAR